MNFDRSSGPDLIPEVDRGEAEAWLEEQRFGWRDAVATRQSLEELPFYLKTVYWTERLFEATRPLVPLLRRLMPGFVGLGVGYHDPELEFEEEGFGPIVSLAVAERSATGLSLPLGTVPLELLYRLGGGSIDALFRFQEIEERSRSGRLVAAFRPAMFTHHGPAVHPDQGVSATLATATGPLGYAEGLLTAKHVVPSAMLGAAVPMSNGEVDGSVVALAPEPVDAAIVKHRAQGTLGQELEFQPFVAQYMPVRVRTPASDKQRRVTQVTDTHDVWGDPALASYIELDSPASGGDSGSLVIDETTGAAAGLYLGRIDAPSASYGRAAHMRQLVELMGLRLYEENP
jgi:hypothetical protein